MKTKNTDLVIQIFLVVVAVILVGLLIAWSTGVFKDKRQDLNQSTNKIDDIVGSVADFDLLVYDGYTIKGSSLVELIDEMKRKDLVISIGVQTLAKQTTYYNYGYDGTVLKDKVTISPTKDKSKKDYITPSGSFKGKLIKNVNNEIICVEFTQQQ